MSAEPCIHVPVDLSPPVGYGAPGCQDCIAAGRRDWVHLRFCQSCGHIGCCNQSPGRHATAHFDSSRHPLVRSYEPGEEWWWCYSDEITFFVPDAPSAPSY